MQPRPPNFSSAWWGFTNATDRQNITVLIHSSIRTVFVLQFQIWQTFMYEQLFKKILTCPNHILWVLLSLLLYRITNLDTDNIIGNFQTVYHAWRIAILL